MLELRVMKEIVLGFVCFNDLGLSDEVMEVVKELGFMEFIEVQVIGILIVFVGENVVMVLYMGFGKIFVYLFFIVQVFFLF